MPRSPQARSREKGQVFERLVRDEFTEALRELLPRLVLRRSMQAERAHDADVIIEGDGVPQWLADLWLECNHAKAPNPINKLVQAEGDAFLAGKRTGRVRLPFVVWRENGCRTIYVSTRLKFLLQATTPGASLSLAEHASELMTTIELGSLLRCLRERLEQAR